MSMSLILSCLPSIDVFSTVNSLVRLETWKRCHVHNFASCVTLNLRRGGKQITMYFTGIKPSNAKHSDGPERAN